MILHWIHYALQSVVVRLQSFKIASSEKAMM
jgi:hypothetical protein